LAEIAVPSITPVAPANPAAARRALENRAFTEPDHRRSARTKAVVFLKTPASSRNRYAERPTASDTAVPGLFRPQIVIRADGKSLWQGVRSR